MNELIPHVKRLLEGTGVLDASGGFRSAPDAPFTSLLPFVAAYFPRRSGTKPASLAFHADDTLAQEGYRLSIDAGGVLVTAATRRGAFHALQTLRQLVADDGTIAAVAIEDAPDLPLRGFMMDISRDKVPSVATVKGFVDLMAAAKMNHLELYVEGFAFGYPSHPEVWRDETPMLPADYEELDRYCAEREIDFVPNLNGFGHMSAWLARPEFKHLAEKEDGFIAWGFPFPPSTLNPLDPESFDLVRSMYADMLPHTRSAFVNINGDEPFELGLGKSAEACAREGKEAVYVGFVRKLCAEAARHRKTPMMWGDVLVNHPDTVRLLPPDVIFIDWGYDHPYPFEEHARMIAAAGVRFVAAPGTSTWNSFAGRRRDMLATTDGASAAVKRHGGLGLLQTDWGDNGHLQYLPFSWPGMLEAAGAAWSLPPSDAAVAAWIDRFAAPEAVGIGVQILKLSDYSRLEREFVYNATSAFKPFLFADPSPDRPMAEKTAIERAQLTGSPYGEAEAKAVLALAASVHDAALALPPSLVRDEVVAAADFIAAGVHSYLALGSGDVDAARRGSVLLDRLLAEHPRLWALRNRQGGLARSLARPLALKKMLEASH